MRIAPPQGGDPAALSLAEAAEAIRTRTLSPVALTRACLARIEQHDRELRAFITVTADSALQDAYRAAGETADGRYRGALHGIPLALKDLVDTAGVRTTAASGVYEQRVPGTDAAIVRLLREAGAVLIGKTNLHEFAFGGSGLVGRFGAAHNPLDTERITGGSSSGSAVAVAACMCCAAIGTDTAGSIRLPAAYCGIVGLKPTHGAVNAEGVIPLSTSLDHVGPMTRTARDAALLVATLLGGPPHARSGRKLRVGIARQYFFDELDDEVARAMEATIDRIRPRVASVRDVQVPVDTDRTVFNYEVWQYHQPLLREHAAEYQPVTLRRIQRTEGVTRQDYESKLAELHALRAEAGDLFGDLDVILTPTTPVMPPTRARLEEQPDELRRYELQMLRNTRPFNVLGLPTITLPATEPFVGLQVSAGPHQEGLLLAAAALFETILKQ